MQMIENIVTELFYELSDTVLFDKEYKEQEEAVCKALEKLVQENGKGSKVDAYLKDVLEGKIEAPELTKEMANSNRGTTLRELENAIYSRQWRAMEFACRESFLSGISFCNRIREMNLFNFKQEKEIVK